MIDNFMWYLIGWGMGAFTIYWIMRAVQLRKEMGRLQPRLEELKKAAHELAEMQRKGESDERE
jgi:hypothetical protein